jgi:hypothetical protein
MSPAQNPSVRRRRLLWAVLPSAAVLLAAAKMLSLGPLGTAAEDAFTAKDAPALGAAADWLGAINLIEPYKADFARGDSHVLSGDFEAARGSFETALRAAPESDGCRIRVNLVLSIEKLGDARKEGGDDAAATALYQDGLDVIAGAPQGCFEAGAQGNAQGEGGRLSEARERLGSKAGQGGDGGSDGEEAPPEDPGAQQQLEQLEESERKARQERLKSQQRSEYLRNPDTGQTAERPW